MLVSKTAGLDGSGSVGDGADGGRSSASSSLCCSVGEIIVVLSKVDRCSTAVIGDQGVILLMFQNRSLEDSVLVLGSG
jgi:hypothetical protein